MWDPCRGCVRSSTVGTAAAGDTGGGALRPPRSPPSRDLSALRARWFCSGLPISAAVRGDCLKGGSRNGSYCEVFLSKDEITTNSAEDPMGCVCESRVRSLLFHRTGWASGGGGRGAVCQAGLGNSPAEGGPFHSCQVPAGHCFVRGEAEGPRPHPAPKLARWRHGPLSLVSPEARGATVPVWGRGTPVPGAFGWGPWGTAEPPRSAASCLIDTWVTPDCERDLASQVGERGLPG